MIALPAWGQADIRTGNGLLSACQSKEPLQQTQCLVYILGALDGASSATQLTAPVFCAPNGITGGQAKDIVVKWLLEHPSRREMPSAWFITAALADAWPCPKR